MTYVGSLVAADIVSGPIAQLLGGLIFMHIIVRVLIIDDMHFVDPE